MTLQPSYSSISDAIADWHTTVNQRLAANGQITTANQTIAQAQTSIASLNDQVNQCNSDEAQLLSIIRNFAQGHTLTELSTQLNAYVAQHPGV